MLHSPSFAHNTFFVVMQIHTATPTQLGVAIWMLVATATQRCDYTFFVASRKKSILAS